MIADGSLPIGGRESFAKLVVAHRRFRILLAFAGLVAERGPAITVTDVVGKTGIARNTFYNEFSGTEELARALLLAARPTLGEHFATVDLARCGLGLLAIELVAAVYVGADESPAQLERAAAVVEALGRAKLLPTAPKLDAHAFQRRLPKGRHGLPPEFIEEYQRERLLSALAAVISENYYGATITDVVRAARTSRRAFYTTFGGKQGAAEALLTATVRLPMSVDPRFGLGQVAVEVVAKRVAGKSGADTQLLAEARWVVEQARRAVALEDPAR